MTGSGRSRNGPDRTPDAGEGGRAAGSRRGRTASRLAAEVARLWTDERVSVRLLGLLAVGIALNLLAWTIAHHLLPAGALRGALPGGDVVPGQGPLLRVFLPIFLYNAVLAGGLIVVANLFRVRSFPLGYLPVLFHWTMYGLFLGTNSFDVARARDTAPSLETLLGGSGFIELSALTFLAAATVGLAVYRQRSWLDWRTERLRAWSEITLRRCEWTSIATAVALLAVAAAREAASILAA